MRRRNRLVDGLGDLHRRLLPVGDMEAWTRVLTARQKGPAHAIRAPTFEEAEEALKSRLEAALLLS